MKDNTALLDFIDSTVEAGGMLGKGLCSSLPAYESHALNNLFRPSFSEKQDLISQSKSSLYWGSGLSAFSSVKYYTFTDLRKTLVAFLLVINEEDFI